MSVPRLSLLLRAPLYFWRATQTCRHHHGVVWSVYHPHSWMENSRLCSAHAHRLHLPRYCVSSFQHNRSILHQSHGLPQVRWSSSGTHGERGGKGEEGGEGGGGKQGGLLRNFIDNVWRGLERDKDMQDSLRGFHEERTKLEQSYVVQAAKQKLTNAKVDCRDWPDLVSR